MSSEVLIARVLHNYEADGDNEMSLSTTDVIEVLDNSTDWWFGKNFVTGEVGLIILWTYFFF